MLSGSVSVKVYITSHSLTLSSWVAGSKWLCGVLNRSRSKGVESPLAVITECVAELLKILVSPDG